MNKLIWPKVGDKIIFTGVPEIYFPHFLKMGEYAREHLVVDREYVLSNIIVNSSWVSTWVEGHEEMLNLSFFKYE